MRLLCSASNTLIFGETAGAKFAGPGAIHALQGFTGALEIDADVLGHRINSGASAPRVAAGAQAHLPPTPLSPELEEVVAQALADHGWPPQRRAGRLHTDRAAPPGSA